MPSLKLSDKISTVEQEKTNLYSDKLQEIYTTN